MKDITIIVTYAELTALIAVNGLFQGVNYLITDRGDRGLLFKAASTSQLEIQGTRYMLCPATYAIGADSHGNNWIGVWNNTKTAILNDLTIWNGQVWKCILAVTEPLDSPDLNDVNWVLIPKQSFSNFEYIEMIFTVSYDVANDWVSKQFDNIGNSVGIGHYAEMDYYNFGFNVCDYTDWNFFTSGFSCFNNKVIGFWNNSNNGLIVNNSNNGAIFNNSNAEAIKNNTNNGDISGNSNNGSINSNKNNGAIINNTSILNVDILNNMNNGSITGIWTENVNDVNVTKEGV